MNVILIALGVLVLLGFFFGYSAWYDAKAARAAGDDFGAGAGVNVVGLRDSVLLAQRLTNVRWRSTSRVGINHGRFVLDDAGLHWSPSWITGRKVPPFSVSWTEVRSHSVKPGPKLVGRRVAQLTLSLSDGTALRFATSEPDGLSAVLDRMNPPGRA